MAKIEMTLQVPRLPNYIMLEGVETHEDKTPKIDVADLTTEQCEALGQEWTAQLIRHSQARRKLKNQGK